MKPVIQRLIADDDDVLRKRSIVREYLQARILQALQDSGAFSNWAFLGGTALRFLFELPRYSEDLDFSLVGVDVPSEFETHIEHTVRDLNREAYDVNAKVRREGAVRSAFLRFRGLLYELGISGHRDEVISVKVELDTNPPAGAGTETRLLRRYVILNILHYDRGSLFADKLHAILARSYTKGRDLYDLMWYLSDPAWPRPNLDLLNRALEQTAWRGPEISAENWKQVVSHALERVDWRRAVEDVGPFLERPKEAELITPQTFDDLLCTS